MRSFRYFLLLLLSVSIFSSRAETFVVTSNADAGPNTFREALIKAAANGNSETDQILFNLSGTTAADLTITLLTALPEITSNLIIDGSSQPSANLGVSGAKITIYADQTTQFSFLVINEYDINVEIYGLKLLRQLKPSSPGAGYGILIKRKCKFSIGAPNKGNIICGFWAGINGNIGNGKIQSNFIGVLESGNNGYGNQIGIFGIPGNDYLENALIGGDQRNEGNVIASNGTGIGFDSSSTGSGVPIQIINNSFGTIFTETAIVSGGNASDSHIHANGFIVLHIKKNVFAPNRKAIDFYNSAQAVVLGNFFGTDRLQNTVFSKTTIDAINGNNDVKFTIGGENQGEDNVFTNYDYPINIISGLALVIKNSFYCNSRTIFDFARDPKESVKILGVFGIRAFGIAAPNSLIQLYDTENSCGSCNPKERFATTVADANGKWEYNGPIKGGIMVSASLNKRSYGFDPINLEENEIRVGNFDCNHGGSIELINKREGNFKYEIKDEYNNVVSTNQNERNLLPGAYYLELTLIGGCTNRTNIFIDDNTPITFDTKFTLDCNQTEGLFFGHSNIPAGEKEFYWEDENGVLFATTKGVRVKAGKYYFYVKDASGCVSNKSVMTVLPAPLLPVLDDSELVYEDADCGSANGSIKKMKVTAQGATPNFAWQDENGKYFSQDIDLVNVPAGKYRLVIYSNSNCGIRYSPYYSIKERNGITIDETNAMPINASCNLSNGKIEGIVVTGTLLSYEWKDQNNITVGTELELNNVSPGKYYLMVNNNTCSKKSSVFTVGKDVSQPFPAYIVKSTKASCHLDNGSLEFQYGAFTPPKSLRWVKDGTTISDKSLIIGLAVGTYELYLTDNFGCEGLFQSYTIEMIKPMVVDLTHINNLPDTCGTKVGSIKGIEATADHTISYTWKDESNTIVATTKDLDNASAGNYTLTVSDELNTTCSEQILNFTIKNEKRDLVAPIISDTKICAAGNATLVVENRSKGTYKLYQRSNDQIPLQINTTGIFSIDVYSKSTYYLSFNIGNCESDKVPVTVTIADEGIEIPSSFSPNGDGVNDLWRIKSMNNYPQAKIKIFNRLGNLVFENIGGSAPFDGTKNNQELPVGIYYYFIELRKGCAILSGTITLIR